MKSLKFNITTPIIMAGADKDKVELREQSIKGILRWWFRFYKGGSLNLNDLRKNESEIFGSQELASRVKLRIKNKPSKIIDAYLCMNDRRKNGENGAKRNYIAIRRKSLSENKDFQIEFRFLKPCDEVKIENELIETIFFMTNFGGIGARWRRGFGSIQLDNENEDFEKIKKEIKQKLASFPKNSNNNDFMNISNTSIYLITKKDGNLWNSWQDCMNDLRDNFYRALKNKLNVDKIILGRASPLIIQIKKAKEGYYGVVLLWNRWLTEEINKRINELIEGKFNLIEIHKTEGG
ncbi:MAG: type III-B CRISPR module RAMP protein Cmr1 [candidate division WOR-3 bacterium]